MFLTPFARRLVVVSALLAATGTPLAAPQPLWRAAPDAGAEQKPKPKDRPAEALQFFLEQRGVTAIPHELYRDAWEHALALPLHSTPDDRILAPSRAPFAANALAWSAVGPGNIGGRTRVIRYHPTTSTTLFAAGVAGGVWRSTNSGATWTPLGDLMANLAVTSLVIDPTNANRMFAGTGEGFFNIDAVRGAGIFLSTDGGANWAQLAATNTSNFLFVNDLEMSPNSTSILYAATSTGLWRSLDGGTSFTQQINASSANGCLDLVVIDNGANDTVLADCGHFDPLDANTAIWRSADANVATPTWSKRLGGANSATATTLTHFGRASLAVSKSDPSYVYALISCTSSGGANDCGTGNAFNDGLRAVYRSTDGGATWAARYTNTFTLTTGADLLLTNPLFAKCFGSSGLNQGWYDNVIAVDPVDREKVYTGGIDIFRSDDGGQTWGGISYWWLDTGFGLTAHADQHFITFHPGYNGTTETRMLVGNDGGIYQSTNGATATRQTTDLNYCPNVGADLAGASWTTLNNSYQVTQFYHGLTYPNGATFFGGTQDNGTIRGTTAGGANAWAEINGGDGGYVAVNPGNTNQVYAETTGISIERSVNGGTSFTSIIPADDGDAVPFESPGEDSGLFINPFTMDPGSATRLWTTGTRIWRTDNSTATPAAWVQAAQNTTSAFTAIAVAPGNSNLVLAGDGGGVVYRTTAGTTATSATVWTTTTPRTGVVSSIAFDPANSANAATAVVYVTYSNFSGTQVFKSTDGGQTFTGIDGTGTTLPNAPAHTLAVHPTMANSLYVGTDVGVYFSSDGGANWARENTGFANVITEQLTVNATTQEIFAFTHGRSVFKASLSGPPSADLSITKTDGVTSRNAGASTTYTITVTNPSASAVSAVTVADTFPAALTGCTWTCTASAGGSCTTASGSGNINNTVAIAASNGTATFSATCTVSASAAGSLANTATVTYAGDANAANNSATDTNTIVPQANLSIAKSDGNTTVNAGANVTYTITATNPSSNTVSGVTIADTFAASLSSCTWTCATSAGGSCTTASGSGNINNTVAIAGSNGTATFAATCTLAASASGSLANTATVSYANDPTPGNNSATDTDTIVPQANLSITKTDGVTAVNAGASLTYTITATNPAAVAITGVTIADTFPAALSSCTWTCTTSAGGSCTTASGSGNINNTVALAANNGTATFAATCTVGAAASGTLSNTASVSYANDPTPGNNSATDANTAIVPQSDLTITKTDGVTAVAPGSPVVYAIVVTSGASVPVTGVTVTDTFPAALTGCTWTCTGASCAAASGSGNIAQTLGFAAGGTATFTATCTLAPTATGTLTNTATVTYANDPDPTDNSAQDQDTVLSDDVFEDGFE